MSRTAEQLRQQYYREAERKSLKANKVDSIITKIIKWIKQL